MQLKAVDQEHRNYITEVKQALIWHVKANYHILINKQWKVANKACIMLKRMDYDCVAMLASASTL